MSVMKRLSGGALIEFSPALLSAYIFVSGLMLSSSNAQFFGRYSFAQLAILSAYFLGILVFGLSRKIRFPWDIGLGLGPVLGFYLLSIFARANQGFRTLPNIEFIWSLQRGLIVFLLFLFVGRLVRAKRDRFAGFLMTATIFLSVLPLFDLTLNAMRAIQSNLPVSEVELVSSPDEKRKDSISLRNDESSTFPVANLGYRINPAYLESNSFKKKDILMDGDSFVFGLGASSQNSSFVNALEKKMHSLDSRSVHAFGVSGAGPQEYIRLLELVNSEKTFRRIVFSFYPNDLDFSPYGDPVRLFLLYSMESASLGIKFFRDKFMKVYSPWDIDSFHRMLVRNFDPSDPTYAGRWQRLKQNITVFYNQAVIRSREKPVFLLLPIMVDFESYPLQDGHEEVKKLAESIGYEVIDVLPEFREKMKDGTAFRSRPDDNHFNDFGHQLVAEILNRRLSEKP